MLKSLRSTPILYLLFFPAVFPITVSALGDLDGCVVQSGHHGSQIESILLKRWPLLGALILENKKKSVGAKTVL